MTKETGVDGISTQVGSTRASVSSHSTVQLQAQPCGLVTAPWSQIAKADHINRLQSRSQMPLCDQIHLCMICLDRPREGESLKPNDLLINKISAAVQSIYVAADFDYVLSQGLLGTL